MTAQEQYTPITFDLRVKAEHARKFPDMVLRLLVRRACFFAIEGNLTLDEAQEILEDEAKYLKQRIKNV